MNIELTGKHIEITSAIRDHVESHFQKLEQFFKGQTAAQAHVVVTVEKNRQIAEIVVNWREHIFKAKETDKDLYQAVGKAIGKLEKQAQKLKEKVVDRKHHARKTAEVAPEPDGAVDAAPPAPRIIAARGYNVKPMTAEEAVLVLNGDGNQFVVYRDSESENVNILYKRADGNYGLIQP